MAVEGDVDWNKVAKIFTPEKEEFLERIKKPLKKYPLARELLLILAGVGAIGVMALMPGLARVVGSEARARQRYDFRRRLEKLKEKKLVEIRTNTEGSEVVEITKKGIKKALSYKFSEMKLKKQKVWDRKWRIVIFDVPETKKHQRDNFREKLKDLGFSALNKSVFIYPFPCFDEIEYVRQIYLIGGNVTYILATRIEEDDRLKRRFNLELE